MSVPSGDYNNTAGEASCNYGTLAQYTDSYSMNVPFQGKQISGQYIVPTWSPISYTSLTSPVPNCSGYYNINNAYGKNAGNCNTTYSTTSCGMIPLNRP